MTILALIGWAIVGWCGTPPRPWPWPWPGPGPQPDPWYRKVIGLVGGVAGGWAFFQLFTADLTTAAGFLVTAVGAWAGSVIFNDVFGAATASRRRA
jgi:hypothetical protein